MATAWQSTHAFALLVLCATLLLAHAWFMTSGSTRCLTQVSVRSALKVETGNQQQELVLPLSVPSAAAAAVQALDYRHIFDAVYRPLNYSACAVPASSGVQCWLPLHKPVDCATLFMQYTQQLQQHKPVFPPPQQLPAGQEGEFLLQGATQLSSYYIQQDDYAPDAKVPVFGLAQFQELHKAAASRLFLGYYDDACFSIYQALDCHPINGSTGAIFGTGLPWLEAILFAFGAKHITTVEFRETKTEIPNHVMLRPLDWAQQWLGGSLPSVDYAFSFSSWEHDGLGRYGDPVDPWGDIKAMQRASCYVKPGGLMYFGSPMSAVDQLQYNAHRIYGFMRLPLMTAGWEVVGVYERGYSKPGQCGNQTCDGLFSHWQKAASPGHAGMQPLVVLRNRRTTPCEHT